MAEQDKPDNTDDNTLERIKTGALERNMALTRMGVGAGAKIAGHTVRNFFRRGESRDEANRNFYKVQAKELVDELGRLKGSVMKAGQMLSLYGQYFLPEEAVEVLATLQDNTPAVSWSFVEPQLIDALGERTISMLNIERKPVLPHRWGKPIWQQSGPPVNRWWSKFNIRVWPARLKVTSAPCLAWSMPPAWPQSA